MDMSATLPTGWVDQTPYKRYPVRAGECYPLKARVSARNSGKEAWEELTWTASSGERKVGSVTVRVYVGKVGSMPR
jgi:hypothetical protein